MRFWDREREKEWLKRYLQTEPNAILFVYGPKSSGKSTLLSKVVEELPADSYKYYWYDLREEVVSGYSSVLRVFFKEKGWKEKMAGLFKGKVNLGVFELDGKELAKVLGGEDNPFAYMREQMERDVGKGMRPVVVFDELQKVKDVYMNSPNNQRPLVKELFNFFVRLTKVLHLAHVIVMTSDTFFIEEVYADSTLKNTSRYYLVDFFDDETAIGILTSEGFREETARRVVNLAGGVPWILEEILKSTDPIQTLEELKLEAMSKIKEFLLEAEDPKAVERVLVELIEGRFELSRENLGVVKELVGAEILFYDPVRMDVRFQTRLDEEAAREVLGVE